jgi:hypothetical protein
LFNTYDENDCLTDHRKKDIIYSKLQKQRSAIQKLESIMKDMKKDIKSKGNQKFGNIEHRQVDSVIKMYEGVDAFVKYVN